jgi:hypothetical protein
LGEIITATKGRKEDLAMHPDGQLRKGTIEPRPGGAVKRNAARYGVDLSNLER